MRLSDKEIIEYIDSGELVIMGTDENMPFDMYKQVQPCSIDLRLGNRFIKYKNSVEILDLTKAVHSSDYFIPYHIENEEPIVLEPHQTILGEIYERIKIPSTVSGMVESRSRFARLGLSIYCGFINPESEGAISIQIQNMTNITILIRPYMLICQLILTKLSSSPLIPYPQKTDNPYYRESETNISLSHFTDNLSQKINLSNEIEKRLINKYLKETLKDKQIRENSLFDSKNINKMITNKMIDDSNIDKFKETLKDLIANNNLKQGLDYVYKYSKMIKNVDFENDITLLLSSYIALKKEKTLNLSNNDEYYLNKAKINRSALDIIDKYLK